MNSHSDELVALSHLASWMPGDDPSALTLAVDAIGDANRFVQLARQHRVVPVIARRLAMTQESQKTAAIQQMLAVEQKQCSQFNLVLTTELVRITAAMEQRKIPSLHLKGPTLAAQRYGGIGNRQFRDLDIVVPAEQISEACVILKEQGFNGVGHQFAKLSRPAMNRLCRTWHQTSFGKRVGGQTVFVELHWQISDNIYAFAPNSATLWNSTAEVTLAGQRLRTLPEPEATIYLALHGAKHRWKRLSWFVDLALSLASRDASSLEMLREAAASYGAERYLLTGLVALQSLRREAKLPDRFSIDDKQWKQFQPMVQTVRQAMRFADDGRHENLVSDAIWCRRLTGSAWRALQTVLLRLEPTSEDFALVGDRANRLYRYASLCRRICGMNHAVRKVS